MITKCLSCGKIFDVELSWKGQTATCDSCGKDFTVKKYIECTKCDCLVPDDSPTCYKCNAKLAVPIEYEISTKTEEKVAEKTTVMVSIINWIKTTAKLEIIPEEINTESEEKAMKCSKCEGCDSSIFKEAQHKLNIPMATNTMPEKKSEEQFNWGCISLVVILLLGLFLITDGYFRLGIIKGLELRYCKELF